MHKKLKYRLYSLISCLLIVTIMLQMTGCNLFNNLFGKSREVVKIEKVEDNKLKITYSDDSTQLLDDNVTPEPCSCTDKKLLVENYQLQGLDRTEDRCKINVQICKSCDKAYITYIDHSSWVDYIIEPTIDTLGESGKKCSDCGFKKDIQKLEFPEHKHNPVAISDEKLNECVIAEYGSLPNPCIETWYSGGSLCECGIWFAKSNDPLGHKLSLNLEFDKVNDYTGKTSVHTKCLTCDDDIYLIEPVNIPHGSSGIFTMYMAENTNTNCDVKCYIDTITLKANGNDTFEDNSKYYTLPARVLIYEYSGLHQHTSGVALEKQSTMTKAEVEELGGLISADGTQGVLHCIKCDYSIFVNIEN